MGKLFIEIVLNENGKMIQGKAEVPFEAGRHSLPNADPFNRNNYVGPDAGYTLNWLSIGEDKETIRFGYDFSVKLGKDGKGEWHNERIFVKFTRIDE